MENPINDTVEKLPAPYQTLRVWLSNGVEATATYLGGGRWWPRQYEVSKWQWITQP